MISSKVVFSSRYPYKNNIIKCKDCKYFKSENKLCRLFDPPVSVDIARSSKMMCYDALYFEPISTYDWVSLEEWW